MRQGLQKAAIFAAAALMTGAAAGQQIANTGFKSVGRGWPLAADLREYEITGPAIPICVRERRRFARLVGPVHRLRASRRGAAGRRAAARRPLHVEGFLQRPRALDGPALFPLQQPGRHRGGLGREHDGHDRRQPAGLGRLGLLRPRLSARSHREPVSVQDGAGALRGAARRDDEARRREPAARRAEQLEEWTGRYMHPGNTTDAQADWTGRDKGKNPQSYWYRMRHNQMPTILSLLTPEYQTRMVQEAYHAGNTNAPQWPSQYCWPEGFMRRWHEFAVWEWHIIAAPSVVQIVTGVARNFITTIHVGREFKMDGSVPRLGAGRAALVRRDDRLLGRRHADHLDVEHPGLEGAQRVRVLEQDADDRDLHAEPRSRPASSSGSITRRSSTTPRRSWSPSGSSATT